MPLRRIINLFSSLGLSLWLLGVLVLLFVGGAFIMPKAEAFRSIHTLPLFLWLKKHGLHATWWLWCSLGVLVLLTVNTLFCSVESLIKKRKGTQWLLLISPQIIHIGFLFMLFAHFMSALEARHEFATVRERSFLKIPLHDTMMYVKEINMHTGPGGYISDWHINVEYFSGGRMYMRDTIAPNKPSIQKGLSILVKDLKTYPYKAVLLQINRDPGSVWALAGGIIFMVGIITLVMLKVKREK